jgi:hypothetical protein
MQLSSLVAKHINYLAPGRYGYPIDPMAFVAGIVEGTLNLRGCGTFFWVGNLLQR